MELDLMIFLFFFALILFCLWVGKKNFDGVGTGYLLASILLIVLGFMILESGIMIQNGAIINRTGSEISSIDYNYSTYTTSNNGFVMVFGYLFPFLGFIGIMLFIGHIILTFLGR